MSQEWMLDILSDLRCVAEKNAMLDLTEHLDDALLIAAREIHAAEACLTGVGDNDDMGEGLPGAARFNDIS